jgi:hypothetical protein
MPWDEEAARKATEEFYLVLAEVKKEAPQAVEKLQAAWKKAYLQAGHKRLGRLMCGKTPQEVAKEQ